MNRKVLVLNRKTYFQNENETILDSAEKNGIYPKNSCRMGICNECKCKLVKGKVKSVAKPYEGHKENEILICSSYPLTDITIEIEE